jgi:sulfur carrier protein
MSLTRRDMPGTILLNGQQRPWRDVTLNEFLRGEGVDLARPGVAVALNARVVPRAQWERTNIGPGDRVEIVQARAGG